MVAYFFSLPLMCVPVHWFFCSANESVTKKSDDKACNFHTARAASHAWWDGRGGKKRGIESVRILSEGQFSGDLTPGG